VSGTSTTPPRTVCVTGSSRRPTASTAASVPPRAHERLQPRDELDERERLGDVVVTSGVESGDAVDERVVRGEEEHRRLDAPSAQRLAEVASVGVGQPDVDDQEVGRLGPEPLEQFGATARADCREALLLEPAQKDAAQVEVVLDDHDLRTGHPSSVALRKGWSEPVFRRPSASRSYRNRQ